VQIAYNENYAQAGSLAYNLSRLRLFALSCPNPKAGFKKVQEFLDQQLLVEIVNVMIPGGLTAIHIAALHGNLQAIQVLVSSGANVNARCKGDKLLTPLHEAVIGGHLNVTRFLLAQGASQFIVDEIGRCPLHYACKLGQVALCRLLMEATGGKRALLLKDRFGHKPVNLCATQFLKVIVEEVMHKHKVLKKPRVSIMER
jgi:ankyrin repeat protein